MKILFLYPVLFVAIILLSGCSSTPQTKQLTASPPPHIAPQRAINNVPFFAQEQYQCGPAALAMVLRHSAVDIAPADLVDKVYVPKRQGSFQVEMIAATRSLERLPLIIQPTLSSVLSWVDAGQPVLVLQNLGLSWYEKWHYAVVVGYDIDHKKIILHSGINEHYPISMALFERTWARSGYWAMVALEPGSLPLAENEASYFLAVAEAAQFISAPAQQSAWLAGLRHWPASQNLLMGYGNYLYGQAQFHEAAKTFKNTIQLHPDYGPAYNNLADTYINLGRFAQAAALAKKAIALDPGNKTIYSQTLKEATGKQQNP
ncbi:MAG: PA2778 family cysteine peptidase [Porticoccaceae bacterium]